MSAIIWNQSYSVGVAEMDKQHIQIVGLLNSLNAASQTTVRSEVISDILTELTKYASEHFLCEEELLEKHEYPGLEEQRREHREYRLKVVELCQDTMNHMETVPSELLQFLHSWWVEHILKSDMEYCSFFQSCGVK